MKSLDLMRADGEPGPQVLHLALADREQGQRQVRLLLGRCALPGLQNQAAAGLLDLHEGAALRLVAEIALDHVLASPLLPDQARQRWSDDEQAMRAPAVWPL
ncbi:hypothetical protein [Microvirga sp. VF16]|uniref:hypothetical protein n=1 Tax=Microvirga sp. VF16 TaxID=2807101 RepID=UPI00193DC894|nr:hypothetical protein [Microvirga sp. VF16]QRM33798.1 hypothetical protein JO965_38140 [Microvirga sp. VF16]